MKTHFTFLLLFFSIFTSNLTAQTVFWEEQFDGGFNGWTEDTIEAAVDTLSWKWTNTGSVGPVMLEPIPAPNIISPTADNGAAYVNFEYWRFGANLSNIPHEPPYGQLISHLISPAIDLSNISGSLILRFNQLAKLLNTATGFPGSTNVSFSADGGLTWSDYIDLNPDLPLREVSNSVVSIPIPDAFELQGSSQVHIRFTYANDFYYWMIDDIQLFEGRPFDLKIEKDSYTIAPNYSTPKSQTEDFPLAASIGAIRGNAKGVMLNAKVQNIDTGEILFDESKAIGIIESGTIAADVLVGNFKPIEIGLYEATYTVSSDLWEGNLFNNSTSFRFEVTENQFRKEGELNVIGINPSQSSSWGMANVFYVPNDSFYAETISFGVANVDNLVGQSVDLQLFSWDGTMEDAQTPDIGSFGLVGFNSYFFDGTESYSIIDVALDLDNNPILLQKGIHYIAALSYEDKIDEEFYILVENSRNYDAMTEITNQLGKSRFGTLISLDGTSIFSTQNFTGNYYVPMIRLNNRPINSSTKQKLAQIDFELFPNPTTDFLNLKLNFLKTEKSIEIQILDVSGRNFFKKTYQNLQKEQLDFDLKNYPPGAYFLKIKTSIRERALPFSIQR